MNRARVLVLPALLFGFTAIGAADWPVFRGDAPQTGVTTAKLPDKLVVRWEFKLGKNGAVEGATAIADGVAYVGSFDEHLYAINVDDGTLKWRSNSPR